MTFIHHIQVGIFNLKKVERKWGRVSIEFSTTLYPSLSAGVYYDLDYHKREYGFPFFDSGLVLAVVIEHEPDKMNEFKNSEKFQNIIHNVTTIENNTGFNVLINPINPRQALVLGKQLSDVLKDENYDNQKECIKEEIIKGINTILCYYK